MYVHTTRAQHCLDLGPVAVCVGAFPLRLSPFSCFVKGGNDKPAFDLLSRRRPGMQDPSGMRVRRRMDKSRTVPTDQQPFNELQELKEDPLFGWAQEDFKV